MTDEGAVVGALESEAGLTRSEAALYLRLLGGEAVSSSKSKDKERLLKDGFAIVSGDGRRIIPVHPRLGVANQYRVWREAVVREVNERRMRVDRLILQLIPIYEAAMEKKTGRGGEKDSHV